MGLGSPNLRIDDRKLLVGRRVLRVLQDGGGVCPKLGDLRLVEVGFPEKLEGLDLGLHLGFLEAGLAAHLFELDAIVWLRRDFIRSRKDRGNVGHSDCLQEATLDRGQVVTLGGGCRLLQELDLLEALGVGEHVRVLHQRFLHDARGKAGHGDALAAALRVPDDAALVRAAGARGGDHLSDRRTHRMELVVSASR